MNYSNITFKEITFKSLFLKFSFSSIELFWYTMYQNILNYIKLY